MSVNVSEVDSVPLTLQKLQQSSSQHIIQQMKNSCRIWVDQLCPVANSKLQCIVVSQSRKGGADPTFSKNPGGLVP